MNRYWVYILHCTNNTYYTGYTNNLEKRYQAHLNGTASKYTRSFKPLKIAQHWEFHCHRREAMQIEHLIKQLSRAEKEALIASPSRLFDLHLKR